MSITPLVPPIQLPSYPVEDYRGSFDQLHSSLIEVHVRCFSYSLYGVDGYSQMPYEEFGEWAAKIGYSLFLLAEDLEGNWLEYPHTAAATAFIDRLRRYSGYWTFIYGAHENLVEGIICYCADTLSLLDEIRLVAPRYVSKSFQDPSVAS